MSHERVPSSGLPRTAQRILTSEVSRAVGLWIVAGAVCLVLSFIWMSAHYDPDRPARDAAKRSTASAAGALTGDQ